jgi:hypothetical protein
LTLGDALGFEIAILFQQRSAFDAIPALIALIIVTWHILDDCSHSSLLLLKPLSWEKYMAKDGEVALLMQP